MKKDIYDYLWVGLYQNYILPTNPSSKNKLFKELRSKVDKSNILNKDKLKIRINTAYLYWGIHLVFMIIYLAGDLYPDFKPSLLTSLENLLINIYPILVQLRTRKRILNVLEHRDQTRVYEEKIIQNEDDVEKIKELIKNMKEDKEA